MFFKKYIQKKVYALYLTGLPIENIAHHLEMDEKDINEIIDYLNEIY